MNKQEIASAVEAYCKGKGLSFSRHEKEDDIAFVPNVGGLALSRRQHCKVRIMMRVRSYAVVILSSVLVFCGSAFAGGGGAVEWKPGAPVSGVPHVIMGAEEGQYLPAPGWRFVNAAQGDATVAPLPANEVRIPAWGVDLRIPAPEGFWSLEDDHPIAKLLKLTADADAKNKTIGMWARTESGLWDDVQSAAVKVTRTIYDKRISLPGFEKMCEGMQEGFNKISKEAMPSVNKMAESSSRELTNMTGTNVNVAVDDVRFLPPYLTVRDRICFTLIRKEMSDVGGEKGIITFTVASCAMLWIRGTVFNLYVYHLVGNNEADIEAAIAATRDKLAKWIAAVESLNNRKPLEDEDFEAKSDPNCVDSAKAKANSGLSIGGKVLMWAVIGGIWGLGASLLKKKKNS